MSNREKMKHLREIEADTDTITARKPFQIKRNEQRRYIRLEIASPMSLQKIKDTEGHYWPDGDWHVIHGTILNISAGGVLVDLDQAIEEGDVVSMHFTLQEVEGLQNILGLVKRVDLDAEGCLVGIEFISRDYLVDLFSQAEVDLLASEHTNFDRSVRQVLDRYVQRDSRLGG